MTPPRTVWLTAKGYAPDEGGQQTYAQGCADAYGRLGAAVTVVTQTSLGPGERTLGAVRLVDLGPGKGPANAWAWRRTFARLLATEGAPDLLHATTWRTALAPVSLGLRPVVSFHGREFVQVAPLARPALALVARRACRRIAVSRYSAAAFRRATGRSALVAWNGLSPWLTPRDADTPRRPGPPRLLSLCRLEPRKNVPALAAALARLAADGVAFEAVLAGRGPDADAVARAAAGHPQITLAGFISSAEAARLYAECDVFAHPQLAIADGRDFEGFGIAIADAMACGAAVIVGASGGSPELVEDRVSGLVVDGADQAALEHALRRLLTDPVARAAMGRAARVRAALFDWDAHVAICAGLEPPAVEP